MDLRQISIVDKKKFIRDNIGAEDLNRMVLETLEFIAPATLERILDDIIKVDIIPYMDTNVNSQKE